MKVLHKHRVLHRDIKPQNILIDNGICKLSDFGVSKIIDDSTSGNTKTFTGTPLYMAPQILKELQYTNKADIWSLGVTFYFMLFKCIKYFFILTKTYTIIIQLLVYFPQKNVFIFYKCFFNSTFINLIYT